MNKENFKELMKKCFGKQKNERYHAIAMLIIYFVFMVFIFIYISTLSPNKNDLNKSSDSNQSKTPIVSNIDYSYSYTININNETEVYLGKKHNNKEKFTLIKNGTNSEYAIINGSYLRLDNNKYVVTDKPNSYFKYCNREKIVDLLKDIKPISENTYEISNDIFAAIFNESVENNTDIPITVTITKISEEVKNIEMDLSNYTSSSDIVKISMNYTDIGTTGDFEIPVE